MDCWLRAPEVVSAEHTLRCHGPCFAVWDPVAPAWPKRVVDLLFNSAFSTDQHQHSRLVAAQGHCALGCLLSAQPLLLRESLSVVYICTDAAAVVPSDGLCFVHCLGLMHGCRLFAGTLAACGEAAPTLQLHALVR